MSKGEWEKLQDNVWSDHFVEAELEVAGKTEPISLRFRGGHTRNYPKKSFEVRRQHDTLHFNAEYDDPSRIRNALSFSFFRWIGMTVPHTEHCLLYINDHPVGVYLEIEGVERSFFQKRGLACHALFYAVDDDANFSLRTHKERKMKPSLFDGYELVIGDTSARRRYERFLFEMNTKQSKQLPAYLEEKLDVNQYLRWLAGAVCTSNYDGFDQNYAMYEDADGRYHILPWDYEGTWGRNCFGERVSPRLVRATGYNHLSNKLMSIPSFRRRYRDLLEEILDTAFTRDRVGQEVGRLTEAIRPVIHLDKMRSEDAAKWSKEPEVILSYVKYRRVLLAEAIRKM